jgi:hypothetical protein
MNTGFLKIGRMQKRGLPTVLPTVTMNLDITG